MKPRVRRFRKECGQTTGAEWASLTYQVAEEISGPLTSAKKITLVSSGGGAMGAAKVTGEVLDILSRLPESVERLTGVSISQVRVCRVGAVEQNFWVPGACDAAGLVVGPALRRLGDH